MHSVKHFGAKASDIVAGIAAFGGEKRAAVAGGSR
jgi:hypothetical protein